MHQDIRALSGDIDHTILVHLEDNLAPDGRYRVVEMDDRPPRTGHAGEGGLDQVAAGLCQALNDHIVGNGVVFNQSANKIEIGGPGCRKADLDLPETNPGEQIEKPPLLFAVHRIDQRLVAVAKVSRQPARCGGYGPGRPLAVGQVDLRKWPIFL